MYAAAAIACSKYLYIVVCVCALVDLGLWILHSGQGQPSKTGDHGKNVKPSINGPAVEEGNIVSPLWARE